MFDSWKGFASNLKTKLTKRCKKYHCKGLAQATWPRTAVMELPPDDSGPEIKMAPGTMSMVAVASTDSLGQPVATPARKPNRLPDLKCFAFLFNTWFLCSPIQLLFWHCQHSCMYIYNYVWYTHMIYIYIHLNVILYTYNSISIYMYKYRCMCVTVFLEA